MTIMGCGSLSTAAFPPSYGTFGDVKAQNFPKNKHKSDSTENNLKQFQQSNFYPGYSILRPTQLKTESGSGMDGNTDLPANGNHQKSSGQINRFTMSVKEIDEDKYKDDDGGIWLGTDHNEDKQTQDKTTSVAAQDSKNEDFSALNQVKHRDANISDAENVVGVGAQFAANLASGTSSKPSTTTKPNVISSDSTVKPLPATASFLQRSQKHRHLQDHHSQYDSVEEAFSNSFGHFDDDKQMSDSELDDYASGLAASETGLYFSEDKFGSDHHGDDGQFTNLVEDENGRSFMPSRLSDDQNLDTSNIETDYPLSGVTCKEHGAQSPTKTKDTMFETFHKQMSLESLPAFPDTPMIPHFMVKCVRYIESQGLKTEGLYRISGNRSLGEQFLKKYSVDPEIDMAAEEIPVHVIATLLKSFVNNLDEALIPSAIYDELANTSDVTDKSNQLAMQREVIKKLSVQQFAVLKYIIDHLHKVSQYQEFNSMNSRNLAKCWWPTLIRLEFRTYENLIQGSQVPEQIVQTLIEQCDYIFLD